LGFVGAGVGFRTVPGMPASWTTTSRRAPWWWWALTDRSAGTAPPWWLAKMLAGQVSSLC